MNNLKINTDPLQDRCYFDLAEFIIERNKIPAGAGVAQIPWHVLVSIVRYHLVPLNVVRVEFGAAVLVSQNSCFRSFEYEIDRGRGHTSLMHTFGDNRDFNELTEYQTRGACDVTVKAKDRFDEFAVLLARTGYKRLCIYPDKDKEFIHGDYNADNRLFYLCSDETKNKWKAIRFEQYLEYADQIKENNI